MNGSADCVVMPVEWGKVREFAKATGAARPVYLDDPTAPVPPTFLVTVDHWVDIGSVLTLPAVAQACAEAGIPMDLDRLLALETGCHYYGPMLRAGESVCVSKRLEQLRVTSGRRGPMVIGTLVVDFCSDLGVLRARYSCTVAYVAEQAA